MPEEQVFEKQKDILVIDDDKKLSAGWIIAIIAVAILLILGLIYI